jgi:FkbM family methyltransferase
MTELDAAERRGIAVVEQAEREFARRSGALRKLWRQQSVVLLADLFHELCDILEADWLVECGAHAAEASERFTAGDGARRAIALEANPFTYATKTSSVAGPRLTALSEGIASRAGKMRLTIPSDGAGAPTPTTASFLAAAASANRSGVGVVVDVTTIDLLQERFSMSGRVALWIDVEGMSRDVLIGGAQTIPDRVVVAILEAETSPVWQEAGSFDEVNRLMLSYGLEPLARDSQQDGQFNMIYLRPEFAPLATDLVEGYVVEVMRPVPLRLRVRHAISSGRKQGLRRASSVAAKERLLRTIGVDRALRLKASFAGRRDAEPAD